MSEAILFWINCLVVLGKGVDQYLRTSMMAGRLCSLMKRHFVRLFLFSGSSFTSALAVSMMLETMIRLIIMPIGGRNSHLMTIIGHEICGVYIKKRCIQFLSSSLVFAKSRMQNLANQRHGHNNAPQTCGVYIYQGEVHLEGVGRPERPKFISHVVKVYQSPENMSG